MQKISKNINETRKIAEVFLAKILKNKNKQKKALVVGLKGELGAGKTAFTQAVGKILGVKHINSPTFVIIKKYPINNLPIADPKYRFLFHIDAYRLKNEKELVHLGWDEIVKNGEHLVFVEWPENIIKKMPRKHYQVLISHTKKGYRKFRIKNV